MFSKTTTLKSFALLLICALLAGCGGAEGRKAKYLERSKSYIASQNFDKATIELKNVLQIDPKNGEAYYLLAQIEEKNKKKFLRIDFRSFSQF